MQLTIDLPEDVTEALRGTWGDISRHALEALAVEGYRTRALTEAQVKRLLNFETRFQVHALLRQYRVPMTTRKLKSNRIWRRIANSVYFRHDDRRRG